MWLHYTRRSKRLVKRLSPAFPWRASWHWAQYDFGASINRLGLETWDERGEWYGIWNDNVDVHPTKITTLICWDFFRKWWSMLRHIVNKNISHCSSSEWRFSCGWRALPFNATRHNEPRMTKENPKITPQNPHAQPSPACNKPSKRLHSSAHIVESHCRLVPTIPSIQKGAIRTGLLRFWHLGAKTTPIVAHCSSHFDVPLLWVITRIIPSTCYPSQKPFALFIKKKQHQHISTLSTINPINPMDLPPSTKKKTIRPPWIGPRNSWLVLCHVFWQSSGRSGSPDAMVSTLRLLGPSISWENKPYFGLDMLDICVEDELLTFFD